MFMRIANQLKTVNVFVMCMSKYKLYLVRTSILADENDLNTDEHSTSIHIQLFSDVFEHSMCAH